MADNQRKILLVEDDALFQGLLAKKLQEAGFAVTIKSDGDQAWQSVQKEKPDLILLDLIIPGIDGFEMLSRLKEDPVLAQIPVIVLSNLGEAEKVQQALALGAKDYLVKAHVELEEIVDRIKKHFQL